MIRDIRCTVCTVRTAALNLRRARKAFSSVCAPVRSVAYTTSLPPMPVPVIHLHASSSLQVARWSVGIGGSASYLNY
jgi:hypothetical protein